MSFSEGFSTGMRWREQKRKQEEDDAMKAELKAIAEAAPEQVTIQPVVANDDEGVPLEAATSTKFMGKTYGQAPNDAEMNSARNMAMAGVIKKYDPMRGVQLEQSMQGADRDNQRFGREKVTWAKQDEDAAREKDYQATRKTILENSPIAQGDKSYQASMAQYQKDLDAYKAASSAPGMEARDMPAAPVAPTRQGSTPGQMLQTYSQLIEHDAKFGKVSTEGLMNFGEKLNSLKKEGYGDALKKLAAGASLEDVSKAFNATGEHKFDAKDVVSDKMVTGPDGVPSRVISVRGEDGSVHTINAVQELDALGQADKIYTRFYAGKQDKRADNADKRDGQRLGMQGAALKREQDQLKATQDAGVALYKEANPDATPAQLEAVRRGLLQATPKLDSNAPAEVKLAKAMMDSGMAPDMKTALEMAISKKGMGGDDMHKEFVSAGIKNMAPPEDAVAKADQTMTAMGYTKGKNGRWVMGGAGGAALSFDSAAEAEAAAKAGKLKAGDKVVINGRTATYKP
jgi:hypothetical protein